jgi:aminoglycoside N3'-acetyltransferase
MITISASLSLDALLDELEIASGSVVCLQTSFRRIGHFGLDGAALLNTIRRRILPHGTLLMPSYPFGQVAGQRLISGYTVYAQERPIFDVRNDPALIGYIPELFRRLPTVRRSMYYVGPMAAEGALARDLIDGTENAADPGAPGSCFERAWRAGATILGLGVTPDTSSLCLTMDSHLGESHPTPIYTPEPQRGMVRDWEGRLRETWTRFILPEALRCMKPSRVFEEDAALRATMRRRDHNEAIHFAYPFARYADSALRQAKARIASGRPLPWLERYTA